MKKSHAELNENSRSLKAQKIIKILGPYLDNSQTINLLEIGSGSGYISSYLGKYIGDKGSVEAVDVVDERKTTSHFSFTKVDDCTLPFVSEYFDIVISNHVIEHVGSAKQQQIHVDEISRVLKSQGHGYMAVPNKYSIIEPHYRLPFLSWLPKSLSNLYLRLTKKAECYDCNPPKLKALHGMFTCASLSAKEVSLKAIQVVSGIEKPKGLKKIIYAIPYPVFWIFQFIIPTRIFLLEKNIDKL